MSLPPTAAPASVASTPTKPLEEVEWSTGLFDCFSNFKNSYITCLFPCITFGQVAEIVDKGSTSCRDSAALFGLASLFCCGGIYSSSYRTKIREQFTLKETPFPDFFVHCFCGACALCQEYRELEHRGFDMAIGWDGNVEGKKQDVGLAPAAPAVEPMTR